MKLGEIRGAKNMRPESKIELDKEKRFGLMNRLDPVMPPDRA